MTSSTRSPNLSPCRASPAAAAEIAHDSLPGAMAVAARLGSPELAASARTAYIDGMGVVLLACAAVVFLGALLTMVFMPGRKRAIVGDAKSTDSELVPR